MTTGASAASPRTRMLLSRAGSAMLLAGVATWSTAMSASVLGGVTLPFSPSATNALVAGVPIVLMLVWASSARPTVPALRLATGWSAVLAALLLLTPKLLTNPMLVIEVPGIVGLAWLLMRWPEVGVICVLAITASFGSLTAYLQLPYNRTIGVTLIGLLLAAIARLVVGRRRIVLQLPLGVIALSAYVALTAVQLLLADDRALALSGFELAPWYLVALLVVAYSQWPTATHVRIIRALVLIAALVGAYATLRLIIGPSSSERALVQTDTFFSAYNYVNGKVKLIGSFPNGADLAAWTSLMIPFCVSCVLGPLGRARLLAGLAVPLLAIGLFGAQSRAAALAALLAVLITVVLHCAARAFTGLRLGVALVASAAVIAIGGGAYAVAGASSAGSGHSYLGLFQGSVHDVSVSQHAYKWKEAFRDLSGHPFGYGLGTAPSGYRASTVTPQFILPGSELSVDNGYLKIALEQGFAVMLVFALGLLLLAVGLARRGVATRDPMHATIILGGCGTLVSLIVLEGSGAYADSLPALAAWLLIGLGVAQLVQRRDDAAGTGQPADSYA